MTHTFTLKITTGKRTKLSVLCGTNANTKQVSFEHTDKEATNHQLAGAIAKLIEERLKVWNK